MEVQLEGGQRVEESAVRTAERALTLVAAAAKHAQCGKPVTNGGVLALVLLEQALPDRGPAPLARETGRKELVLLGC